MNGVPIDVETLHGRFAVVEATAVLRHDLRNKLAAVRNAAFYIQRRLEKEAAELLAKDARMSTFLGLIRTELDGAEGIIADRVPHLDEPVTVPFSVDEAIAAALTSTPHVRHVVSDLMVRGAADELAVAIRCLVDNATEAGARTITVGASRDGDRVVVTVTDDGPGIVDAAAARPGHMGLGIRIVKRIAARGGGDFTLAGGDGRGVRAAITLPGGGG